MTPVASIQPSPTPIVISTPDPASVNWKIYTNTKLGFSFKYPSNWIFYEENYDFNLSKSGTTSSPGTIVKLGRKPTTDEIKAYKEWYMQSPPNDLLYDNIDLVFGSGKSFDKFNLRDFVTGTDDTIISVKPIVIDQNVVAEEYDHGCQSSCLDVVFRRSEMVFDFSLVNYSDKDPRLQILPEILSTFKFTN